MHAENPREPAHDPLLQPFHLKHLRLKNRVMSTAHEPAYSEDGMPKDRYRAYHVEKAKGGLAMTMTAGTAVVSPDSPPAFGNLFAYDDAIVPWVRRMTDEIHEHDCAAMIQISHLGRRTGWGQDAWLPVVAPSALREPAHRAHPKAAEIWDINRIVADYADAAERMQAGGMDGVEVEAYGHLFDQFWSPATNHRTDEWGGSFENRMRFPLAVLRAIRSRVGSQYLVGVRMAVDETRPDGIDTPTGIVILEQLAAEGLIDFVNVIRGSIVNDAVLSDVIPIQGMPAAPHLEFAGMVRERTGLAVFHAAKIDDVATARHAVREGKVDMIGMTRAHLADPYLVRKIELGQEATIRPCVGATYCLDRIYMAGEALCIHNAATGRELTMPHVIEPAATARRVLVVGAGVGGLEAARVAAERGHRVTVLEAMPWPGGQLRLAARNTRRRDLLGIVEWRVSELERLGVDVRYDTFADADAIDALTPDVVIIATGGLPQNPPIEAGGDLMVNAWDVVGGDARLTGDVVLYDDDGTHSAMTTAEMLARSGARVEIVTPERTMGVDVGGLNLVPYARAFNETDTRVTLNQRVRSISRDQSGRLRVQIGSDHSPVRHDRLVDAVVGDHGVLANDELYHELVHASTNLGELDHRAFIDGGPQTICTNPDGRYQLFRIGDAVAGRNIHAAVYDALRLCKDL
ncbi:MAG: NADH:flavin oxidoreductase [Ilumatobacteraceae bacterium]|jgi:2,4-dienoyl-CoA reductase-like NADH-dependent reductase (Old Yellow Enzyme family)/thioredoxin reductase|nr:NADH:flavin oxidoreductase [Acidimicrobiaceae bacterium]MBP6487260.1 NADH:flavin oxidoreductase [Ilumatobacteraceae bacterium]MBK9972589.1 NADH:flavin oxidoreductase [Acidimicrobiaceae bacterium]MBP7887465.1 NADH:flavin oxidoreductase [Ilumatobacteraceae bacterium]MBP8211149.1 NADH:flavin oxidoreductase [Ilumatobacteraceae bacterium]